MDGVVVAGRLGVRGNLLPRERDPALCHERITNRARDLHSAAPSASVVSLSKVTKRMPRRLVSEATRPTDVSVSPTRGWCCHSKSCSVCRSRAYVYPQLLSPDSC